jgi:hypothetical protein
LKLTVQSKISCIFATAVIISALTEIIGFEI